MKSGITNGNCAITRKVFTYEDIAGQAVRGDFLLFTDNVSLARTVAALLIAGKHVSAFDPEIKEQLVCVFYKYYSLYSHNLKQAFYNKKIKDKQISLNDLIPTVRTKKDKKIKQARESASSASARPFNLKAAVMEIIESLLKEMNIGNLPNDLQQVIILIIIRRFSDFLLFLVHKRHFSHSRATSTTNCNLVHHCLHCQRK